MPHFDSSIFDLAPIPMWLEDFSEVKLQFDQWRADGVEDLVSFLQADMQRIVASTHKIKIIKVNQKVLERMKFLSLKNAINVINDNGKAGKLSFLINKGYKIPDGYIINSKNIDKINKKDIDFIRKKIRRRNSNSIYSI